MDLLQKNICVIGLGYVGLPLLLELSKKTRVFGFDINKDRIRELKKTLQNKRKKISIFSNFDILPNIHTYIITVPTPVYKNLSPDLSYLESASKMVGRKLNKGNFVIYESTVYPGTTEEICIPILEKFSGLKCKFNNKITSKNIFYVGYSPERISPGDKQKFSNIVKVTSGSNTYSAQVINKMYNQIINKKTYIAQNIKTAEASKIVENIQRDTNLALINQLAVIMNRLNLNIYDVLKASRTKWNFHYYTPGFVGGHCIAVDPYYMIHKSKKIKTNASLLEIARNINESMPIEICKIINRRLKKDGLSLNNLKVAILGCSYKENLSDTRNTKVFDLFHHLKKIGSDVSLVDPVVEAGVGNELSNIRLTPIKKINKVDFIFLAVPHDYFLKLSKNFFLRMYNQKLNKKYFFDLKCSSLQNKLKNSEIQVWSI